MADNSVINNSQQLSMDSPKGSCFMNLLEFL